MSFVNINGGPQIPPSNVSYQAFDLTTFAEGDVNLVWPFGFGQDSQVVASIVDFTAVPSVTGSCTLPSALQVSVGQSILFKNKGAYNVLVLNNSNTTTLSTIEPGKAVYLYLTDNTTIDGAWEVVAFGAGTSQADASALAGLGLIAFNSKLNTNSPVTLLNSATVLTAANRAAVIAWTGGTDTITLPLPGAVNVGNGFYVTFTNQTTLSGLLTIQPTPGVLINNQSNFLLNDGESVQVISDGTAWYTFGFGRTVLTNVQVNKLDVSGNTNRTLTTVQAAAEIQEYYGALTGNITITTPATPQTYFVYNNTTGAFTLTFTTAGSAGFDVPQGQKLIFMNDGTTGGIYQIPSNTGPVTVTFPDGTISDPGIAFTNNLHTGFSRNSGSGALITSVAGSAIVTALPSVFQASVPVNVPNGTASDPSLQVGIASTGLSRDSGSGALVSTVAGNAVLTTGATQVSSTQPVKLPAGLLATPALQIGSSPLGLYAPTSSTLAIVNSSIQGMLVTPGSATTVQLPPYGTFSGNTANLRFLELAANGSEYVALKAPDSIDTSVNVILPDQLPFLTNTPTVMTTGGQIGYMGPVKDFRNVIMGGSMDTNPFQRGKSFSSMSDGVFVADRFRYGKNGLMVESSSVTTGPGNNSYPYGASYLTYTVTTPQSSLGATDYSIHETSITGRDLATLWAKPITISFTANISTIGEYSVALRTARSGSGTQYCIQTFTVTNANVDRTYSVTFPAISTGSSGVFNLVSDDLGLSVVFVKAAGPSFQGTVGAWGVSLTTDVPMCSPSQVNGVGLNGATFRITNIQMESGYQATPFSGLSSQAVWDQCRQYWFQTYNTGVAVGTVTITGVWRAGFVKTGSVADGTSLNLCNTPIFPWMNKAHQMVVSLYEWGSGTPGVWQICGTTLLMAPAALTSTGFNLLNGSGSPFAGATTGEAIGHFTVNCELI